MDGPDPDPVSDAVLYEGYLLYPYRPSALKNRVRWLFGRVFPESSSAVGRSEVSLLRTECLAVADAGTRLRVRLRFLHLVSYTAEATSAVRMATEASERRIECEAVLAETTAAPAERPFEVPANRSRKVLHPSDGRVGDVLIQEQRALRGMLAVSAAEVEAGILRVAVEVRNRTPLDAAGQADEAAGLLSAFVSTHLLLDLEGGEFVSLREPPEPLAAAAAECRQTGLWPVPVGPAGTRNRLLAAPIILDDYPQIAPESVGDLFDGAEIDEMLMLRLRTLSDGEKQEIRAAGGPAAALVDQAETLPDDDLLRLHGALRPPAPPFRPGDRVRLHPRGRADAFDHFLAGRTAVVTRVERDFEDREHVAVTLDDDPGRDLGELGMPGHRFFFGTDELERLDGGNSKSEARNPKQVPMTK